MVARPPKKKNLSGLAFYDLIRDKSERAQEGIVTLDPGGHAAGIRQLRDDCPYPRWVKFQSASTFSGSNLRWLATLNSASSAPTSHRTDAEGVCLPSRRFARRTRDLTRLSCSEPTVRRYPLLAGSSQKQAQTRRRKPVVHPLAEATIGRAGRPTGSGREPVLTKGSSAAICSVWSQARPWQELRRGSWPVTATCA